MDGRKKRRKFKPKSEKQTNKQKKKSKSERETQCKNIKKKFIFYIPASDFWASISESGND